MKIIREQLLTSLKLVQPAIATKPILEELVNVWFNGKTICAYNDVIGIEAPFTSELNGGLHGDSLITFVSKSRAKEVDISGESQLTLKAGNAKFEMSLMELERQLWEFPKFETKRSIPIDATFLDALTVSLISIGSDTSTIDCLGVTIIPKEDEIELFSTDCRSLSKVVMKNIRSVNMERCVIPAVFCEELIKLYKKTGGNLYIDDDMVITSNSQSCKLFSRLIEVDKPLDFYGILDSHISDDIDPVTIPRRLKLSMERMVSLIKPGGVVEFKFENNRLKLQCETAVGGELKDSMTLEEDDKHPDVVALFSPDLVKRVLPLVTKFAVTENCMVMTGPKSFNHYISPR